MIDLLQLTHDAILTKIYSTRSNEKTDIILIFGECRLNGVAAANLYGQRYPN
jgi:hypothetical protein